MPKQETILFAPLNWGLGHATRIVPLINKAKEEGHKIVIGADGVALSFLQKEFPDLETKKLIGFNIKYWPKPFFSLGLFFQLPLFYLSIFFEKRRVKSLIKRYEITQIISDNRYGIRSSFTHNILITHQLFIKVPKAFKIFEASAHLVTKNFIQKFDECWVPDYEAAQMSLSGELSHGRGVAKNVKYIGPLSRFQNYIPLNEIQLTGYPDVLILISGPEPARSNFEHEMEARYSKSPKKVLMVCGRPGVQEEIVEDNFRKVSHLATEELYYCLKNSTEIIARSGYSTIMDLHLLNRTAELIPTPGQSEQEYLSDYLYNK